MAVSDKRGTPAWRVCWRRTTVFGNTIPIAARKVDVRLPGKGNSNSQGARPVHLIVTMIKWIRTSRLSIKNSLSTHRFERVPWARSEELDTLPGRSGYVNIT